MTPEVRARFWDSFKFHYLSDKNKLKYKANVRNKVRTRLAELKHEQIILEELLTELKE